jgi:hypothetical protein
MSVEPGSEDADFYASLPQDPFSGPRAVSRSVVWLPESLGQLFEILRTMPVGWIWRGQGSFNWRLETRLGRDFANLPLPSEDPSVSYDYVGLENRVIGFFKERARRSVRPPPDDLDLLSWLAVMQHYGAPTRLLDWTTSPFVALWFAYADAESEPAALWGLNAYLCRRGINGALFPGGWDHLGIIGHNSADAEGNITNRTPALEIRQRDRENEFLRWAIKTNCRWPLPVIPFDTDARMTAQQTVLTCVGNLQEPVDQALLRFDEWRNDTPSENPPGGYRIGTDSTVWPLREPADLLLKLHLPREWRPAVLHALGSMGIDAATLFPGLDGVGRQASMYLDLGQGSLREVITDTFGL